MLSGNLYCVCRPSVKQLRKEGLVDQGGCSAVLIRVDVMLC